MNNRLLEWARAWRGNLFAGAFGLLALAAVFAHRGAAPLLLLLAFAAPYPRSILAEARGAFPPGIKSWCGLLFYAALAFCLWTGVSALWSPLPEKVDWSWRYGFAFLVGGLSFYAVLNLSPADKRRAGAGLAWAILVMAALLAFERLSNGALRELVPPDQAPGRAEISLGRGAFILVCLAWPAREILARQLGRPLLGWALMGAVAIAATGFSIQTNAVALILAAAVYGLARLYPTLTLKSVFSLLIASVWLAPFIAVSLPVEAIGETFAALPTSWMQRLHIWRYAGGEILAQPFGGGVDYARSLGEAAPRIEINGVTGSAMPLHPHNLALHFWIDLGVFGAAILTAALVAIYRGIKRAAVDPVFYPLISAVLMSFFVSAMTEWSMWQVWRYALCWFAAAAVALAINGVRARQDASQ